MKKNNSVDVNMELYKAKDSKSSLRPAANNNNTLMERSQQQSNENNTNRQYQRQQQQYEQQQHDYEQKPEQQQRKPRPQLLTIDPIVCSPSKQPQQKQQKQTTKIGTPDFLTNNTLRITLNQTYDDKLSVPVTAMERRHFEDQQNNNNDTSTIIKTTTTTNAVKRKLNNTQDFVNTCNNNIIKNENTSKYNIYINPYTFERKMMAPVLRQLNMFGREGKTTAQNTNLNYYKNCLNNNNSNNNDYSTSSTITTLNTYLLSYNDDSTTDFSQMVIDHRDNESVSTWSTIGKPKQRNWQFPNVTTTIFVKPKINNINEKFLLNERITEMQSKRVQNIVKEDHNAGIFKMEMEKELAKSKKRTGPLPHRSHQLEDPIMNRPRAHTTKKNKKKKDKEKQSFQGSSDYEKYKFMQFILLHKLFFATPLLASSKHLLLIILKYHLNKNENAFLSTKA